MLHLVLPDPLTRALPALWTALLLAPLPVLAWAAWTDLVSRIIPDGACIALALYGLLLRGLAGPWALAELVAIAVLAFIALAMLHARGGFGGGDVKLAAAILLGLSPPGAYTFLVVTVLTGGVLAILHLALRALPPPRPAPAGAALVQRLWRAERWRVRRHRTLPYGIALASGGGWAFLTSVGA